MPRRDGFTLVELLIALVLFGIVGTSIYQLLLTNQRLYTQQRARVNTNQAARAAASILPNEIRELAATDSNGSDILAATTTGFRYRALQDLSFACANGAGTAITVSRDDWFGLRRPDAATDSLLIFAEGDPATRGDDAWLHADLLSSTAGASCAGGTASVTFNVNLLSGTITGVLAGAPVRSYQVAQVQLYQDAGGAWWLGRQTINKTTGVAGVIQPIVGPLSSAGLTLSYYAADGAVTTDRSKIARIRIAVEAQSAHAVQTRDGLAPMLQDLVTDVSLRNNCRYYC